jgi:hypothetical protein
MDLPGLPVNMDTELKSHEREFVSVSEKSELVRRQKELSSPSFDEQIRCLIGPVYKKTPIIAHPNIAGFFSILAPPDGAVQLERKTSFPTAARSALIISLIFGSMVQQFNTELNG